MYVRGCMYILLGLGPYLTITTMLTVVAERPGALEAPAAIGLAVASGALCAACIVLYRRGIARYLGGPAIRARVYGAVGAPLCAAVTLAYVAFPAPSVPSSVTRHADAGARP